MTASPHSLLKQLARLTPTQLSTLTLAERDEIVRGAEYLHRQNESLAGFIARATPRHREIPWHLLQLIAVLERAMREPTFAIVSMPPRHGKTVTVVHALAYATLLFPDRRNAFVTHSGDYAEEQSRVVRRLVTDRGGQLAKDATAVGNWRTPQGGGLAATGIGGQLTGKGFAGIVVVDDPIRGQAQAESPAEREKAWRTFNSDAFTRLEPPTGSCILVTTRWNLDDVAGRLEAMRGQPDVPDWELINLPAIRGADDLPADDGSALWPERYPLDALRRIRAQIGEYPFAALYQGHPVPRGGALFRVPARYVSPDLPGARIVAAVDPAGSASTRADYTAAVVLAVHGYGADARADVLEVLRLQQETAGAAEQLALLQQRHGGVTLHIEASRDGKQIKRALEAIDRRLSLAEVPPVGDKYTRAMPAVAAWNAGRIRIPAQSSTWVTDLIHETEKFTGVADAHDDQVDALAYAWAAGTTAQPVRSWSASHE